MGSPVEGLTPFRAALCRTSNVPKPTKVTFSPSAKAWEIVDNIASTASLAVFFDRPDFSAFVHGITSL